MASSGVEATGGHLPSRAEPKRKGAGETKLKRGLGRQHRRQPTKKLPQPHSPPCTRPARRRGGPSVPSAAGLGKAGAHVSQVPLPGGSPEDSVKHLRGCGVHFLAAGSIKLQALK